MSSGFHQGEQIIIVLLIFFKTPGKILKKIALNWPNISFTS